MASQADAQPAFAVGAEPEVLGRLLAAQTLLPQLPDVRTILEFVVHALQLVPQVQASAARENGGPVEILEGDWGRLRDRLCDYPVDRTTGYAWYSHPQGEVLVLDIGTLRQAYGCLYALCSDRAGVAPYLPFLINLAGSVALKLENRAQRRIMEETTAELEASKREYELLFQEMSGGFATHEIIVDGEGKAVDYRFLSVNRAFERLTGLRGGDIIGRTAKEVLPGLEEYWIETYGDVALHGKHVRFENYSAALCRHYEVAAYSPSPGRFATLFSDITERKQHEAALSRTAAEMEAAYKREHEVAERLQMAFLPEIRPIPGLQIDLTYHSASDNALVGGDFYDLVMMPNGRVMIAVGDVCGKGVQAAKRMAVVRHTMRAVVADDLSAGDWLGEVNRRLIAMDEGSDFVTVALILLDPSDGRLEFSLAGHPPPYLVAPSGLRELRGASGAPLGVFADGVYPAGREQLAQGDVLLLYTDGLSEARCGDSLFGQEELPARVGTLLQRPFVGEAERLVESAQQYGRGELRDDVVVVLLRLAP